MALRSAKIGPTAQSVLSKAVLSPQAPKMMPVIQPTSALPPVSFNPIAEHVAVAQVSQVPSVPVQVPINTNFRPSAIPLSIANVTNPNISVPTTPLPKVDATVQAQPGPTKLDAPASGQQQAQQSPQQDQGQQDQGDGSYVDPGPMELTDQDSDEDDNGDGGDDSVYVPDPQEEQSAVITGDPVLYSSHISNGCLNTATICLSPFGFEVLTSRVKLPIPRKTKAVPIQFGAETASPTLNMAMNATGHIINSKANKVGQKHASKALVERARVGDQNAMAIISRVRQNAIKGNPVAKSAFGCLKEYIQNNPAGSIIHGEDNNDPNCPKMWVHIWLANGPLLNNTIVEQFTSSFGAENQTVFLQGILCFRDQGSYDILKSQYDQLKQKILEMGQIFGKARALQLVRMPNSRISMYSRKAGWELGEN